MARTKKGEVSKSDSIRAYFAAHKGAKAAAVVAGLAEQGIVVGLPLVYALKRKGKRGPKRAATKTTRGPAKATSGNGQLSLQTLLAAKKLADAVGGFDNAREALLVLEKLS